MKENHFIQIIKKVWPNFKKKYPSYATVYYDSIINKTIHCRDKKFGYTEYICMTCGRGSHRSGFSCKTKFCIHCSRTSSMDFIEEMMCKLHPGVVYRHLILTIPEQLRKYFYNKRFNKDLYNEFIRAGKTYIEDVFRTVTRKKRLKIGCVVVLHMAGRKGTYNPHLHIIVMNGGIDEDTGRWVEIKYFNYKKILPRKWQWHLLNMLKKFDPSPEMTLLRKKLWKKYKKGFVNNFKKGDVPKEMGHLVKYLARYISKPSISVSSILKCDYEKERVTYSYRDHKSKKKMRTTCNFIIFIGRLVQQILPAGFHRIRYFGLQHPSSYIKRFDEITNALKLSGMNVHENTFMAYATKSWEWKVNPKKCSFCEDKMEIYRIWSKKYGEIYNVFHELANCNLPPPKDEENLSVKDICVESCFEQIPFIFA